MSERGAVGLVEDWQSGAALLLGCAVVGVAVGLVVGSLAAPWAFLPGFVLGGVAAFLAYAYLRHGR